MCAYVCVHVCVRLAEYRQHEVGNEIKGRKEGDLYRKRRWDEVQLILRLSENASKNHSIFYLPKIIYIYINTCVCVYVLCMYILMDVNSPGLTILPT